MRSQVKRWGNSASVRIPAAVLNASALKLDQPVEVIAESGAVIIKAVTDHIPTLDEMLDSLTPQNMKDDFDWGPPVGKEIW